MALTIPVGNVYPKMVTINAGPFGGLVPAIFPSGHAKQFQFIILNSASDEAAFGAVGVAPTSNVASGYSGSWENRHGGR